MRLVDVRIIDVNVAHALKFVRVRSSVGWHDATPVARERKTVNLDQQVESTTVREGKIDKGGLIRSIIQMICNADR